jgi:hypothetical protein
MRRREEGENFLGFAAPSALTLHHDAGVAVAGGSANPKFLDLLIS